MERRSHLGLARALLVTGGLAVAAVGWLAVSSERESARLRAGEVARDAASAGARTVGAWLRTAAQDETDDPLADGTWTLEVAPSPPVADARPAASSSWDEGLLLDEAAYQLRARDDRGAALAILRRLASHEPDDAVALVASLWAGTLSAQAGDADGARTHYERAARAGEPVRDPAGVPVRVAALAGLARLDLARGDATGVERLLAACDDGRRVGDAVPGPADLLDALARDLGPRVRAIDARVGLRLDAAARRARDGARWLSRAPGAGVHCLEDRVVLVRGTTLRVLSLDDVVRAAGSTDVEPHAPPTDHAYRLARATELLPHGAASAPVRPAPEPEGLVAYALPPPPTGWGGTAVAFCAGLLVYALGAGFALAALARSGRVARMQEEFVAAVSHEMKTPIASVGVMAEMLADGRAPSPDRAREYAERIGAEMRRLGTTVRNVLDASRIERATARLVEPRPVDPAQVVRDVTEVMRPSLEARGFRFDVAASPPPHPLPLDPDALTSVLCNLLDNAAKFSRDRKEIDVRAGPRDGGYRVEVLDRGPGVAVEDRGRVFERFGRGEAAVRGAVPGVGIGLHVARELVLAHGGSMRVEDREGGGATFVVELPGGRT